MRTAPGEGSRLGGYHLETHLARGGMADIYVARSPHGHQVALKCIRPTFAQDQTFVDLFLREAQLSMVLEHGNIARVFDFGEEDGHYFMVMEYVRGPALFDLLQALKVRRRPFPIEVAAHVLAETAAGLAHAHGRVDEAGRLLPVVHRDISPQNVLVALDGTVKVVDFGIAKARDSQNLTRPGVARGKYLYFSPEQVKQQPLDGKSDVYACGVVLYELLAGRRPFEGELIEVLGKIVRGDFPPLAELKPELPRALVELVGASLAQEPGARPSAAAMEATLRGWLRGEAHALSPAQATRALVEECWDEDEERTISGEPTHGDAEPPAATGRAGASRLALALGAVVALGLGAALLLGRSEAPPPATRIESNPTGARISFPDLGLEGTAPFETSRLEPGHPYRVEATLEGHEPGRRIVVGGDRLRFVLAPRPKAPVLLPPEPTTDEADPVEGEQIYARVQPSIAHALGNAAGLGNDAPVGTGRAGPWPLRELTLSREKLVENAAHLPLDPRRPHTIRAQGRVEVLSGFQPIHQALYYADGRGAVPDRFGLIDSRKGPLRLGKGHEALHAILLDAATARSDSPTMRDLVDAWPTGSLVVRTRSGSVSLRFETQRLQLRRMGLKLLPLNGYRLIEIEVQLHPEEAPGVASPVFPEQVFFAGFRSLTTLGGSSPEASAPVFTVVGDGKSFTLDHVNELWVFVIAEDPEQVVGSLSLQIRDLGPGRELDEIAAEERAK
ncbi:MAG: serine/threonine protein kinase [Deltaproteobacteria bacterium]|nr:serine/threonine protein kinase [Deltaproteobacteria bacterium]